MCTVTAAEAPASSTRSRPRPFVSLVKGVSRVAPSAKPRLQQWLIRGGSQVLNRRRAAVDAVCLNYGYAPAVESSWTPHSDVSELADRYGLQLYDRVAGGAPLAGADVLEVGCGRGGGAAYVAEVFGTRAMTGIDFSARAVQWCQGRYGRPGLSFRQADAEALPFGDASFDAVLNVESSHCYPDVERFLDETRRVLRPGGVLLMADLRPADQIDRLRDQLAARFVVEDQEEITTDVVRALELDAPRRLETIRGDVPALFRPAVRDFFAVPGSAVFTYLSTGGLRYHRFVLRVPGPA